MKEIGVLVCINHTTQKLYRLEHSRSIMIHSNCNKSFDNSITKDNEKYPMFKNVWYSNFDKSENKSQLPVCFSKADKFDHEMPTKMIYYINQFYPENEDPLEIVVDKKKK